MTKASISYTSYAFFVNLTDVLHKVQKLWKIQLFPMAPFTNMVQL